MVNWKYIKGFMKRSGIEKVKKEEVLNTLNYNGVLNEIAAQIKFLREEENTIPVEEEIKQVAEKHKVIIIKL